jgi:integrase
MDAWTPHDLRRTVRTTLAALGCPDVVGEAVLGHAPAGIVGVYNRHAYDAERRHWLTRLAQHWETLAPQG